MKKFQSGRKWFKGKLRGTFKKSPKDKKLVIGPPSNFRREDITLGTDINGNAVLIEQAREDAKAMHEAAKKEGTV